MAEPPLREPSRRQHQIGTDENFPPPETVYFLDLPRREQLIHYFQAQFPSCPSFYHGAIPILFEKEFELCEHSPQYRAEWRRKLDEFPRRMLMRKELKEKGARTMCIPWRSENGRIITYQRPDNFVPRRPYFNTSFNTVQPALHTFQTVRQPAFNHNPNENRYDRQPNPFSMHPEWTTESREFSLQPRRPTTEARTPFAAPFQPPPSRQIEQRRRENSNQIQSAAEESPFPSRPFTPSFPSIPQTAQPHPSRENEQQRRHEKDIQNPSPSPNVYSSSSSTTRLAPARHVLRGAGRTAQAKIGNFLRPQQQGKESHPRRPTTTMTETRRTTVPFQPPPTLQNEQRRRENSDQVQSAAEGLLFPSRPLMPPFPSVHQTAQPHPTRQNEQRRQEEALQVQRAEESPFPTRPFPTPNTSIHRTVHRLRVPDEENDIRSCPQWRYISQYSGQTFVPSSGLFQSLQSRTLLPSLENEPMRQEEASQGQSTAEESPFPFRPSPPNNASIRQPSIREDLRTVRSAPLSNQPPSSSQVSTQGVYQVAIPPARLDSLPLPSTEPEDFPFLEDLRRAQEAKNRMQRKK